MNEETKRKKGEEKERVNGNERGERWNYSCTFIIKLTQLGRIFIKKKLKKTGKTCGVLHLSLFPLFLVFPWDPWSLTYKCWVVR